MRCLPACFGHLKRNATMKKVQDQCLSPSNEQNESVKLLPDKTESQKEEEEIIINPIKIMSESEYTPKEQTNIHISNEENTVFDDSNVENCSNELASSNSDNKLVLNKNGEVQKEMEKDKDTDESNSKNSLNDGHQDFLINDKECAVEEESCSSLFSLSIDSRKQVIGAEMGEKEEVSSLLKMKNNTSIFKYDEDEEKENVPLSKDPMMEQTFDKSKPMSVAIVETSLSTWLVESEKSTRKMGAGSSPESEKNYGYRQILGVMNASSSPADVKKLNGFSSVGSTPCCSGDDQPSIGTVGRYWRRRGGPAGEMAEVASGSSCREVSSVLDHCVSLL